MHSHVAFFLFVSLPYKMTSYENVLGLDIAQNQPARAGLGSQGAPLCSVYGKDCDVRNGLRTIGKPGLPTPQTRVLMFAQPACSRKPDTDAGTIYYLPSGRYYKTVQGRMIPLPDDPSKPVDVPVGITDVWARPPGYQPDIYRIHNDQVFYMSGYCDESHPCVLISDITSDRDLAPVGYKMPPNASNLCSTGNAQVSHLGLNVPLNPAFSTMMVTDPMHRTNGGAYNSGSMEGPGKPRLPLSAQAPDFTKGFCVPDVNWCCQYGVHDIPFPRLPLSGNDYAAIADPVDTKRACVGCTTNTVQ